MSTPTVCLTIAGNDPSGGAGLAADLKTFAARGVYSMAVLTVATDCDTQAGVEEVQPMPPAFVRRQIARVCTDIPPQAVKTGMLFSEEIIRVVAEALCEHAPQAALVVDPVMTTRRGERLLSDEAEETLADELFSLATVVTPSLPEAERLAGRRVLSRQDMEEAAAEIHALGPKAVCITGGHLGDDRPAADCFFDGDDILWLEAERAPRRMHGAGDTFSAATAGHVAQGVDVLEAVRQAKAYVTGAIRHAPRLGRGNGPLGHGWEAEGRGPEPVLHTSE